MRFESKIFFIRKTVLRIFPTQYSSTFPLSLKAVMLSASFYDIFVPNVFQFIHILYEFKCWYEIFAIFYVNKY